MLLVANRSRRCEEEGAGDHGDNEREAEEGEGMFREAGAVFGGDGVGGGGGAELFGLEDCHGDVCSREVMIYRN